MSRMLLVWSLLLGLALAGADWYASRGRPQALPSSEGGTPINAVSPHDGEVRMMEGGTPLPRPPK
jgi:hypothetical protein